MASPKVSIIILNWNKLEYTRNCLSSLEQNTGHPDYEPDYEIIVFDNGSTEPGTREYLSTLPHTVIMHPENLGFAKGNNRAARHAKGEFLLFLNNDTVAHTDWLRPMLDLFRRKPGCGIVGSRLLYPDGTIQHVGVVFDHRGNRRHLYKRYPPAIPPALEERECEAVTGACLLLRREVFTEVRGFDEEYVHGSEDIDLCLKVRGLGLTVWYCPDSVLTHYEQVSLKAQGSRFKKRTTRRNNRRFARKWGVIPDRFKLSHDLSGLKPFHYYYGDRPDIAALVPASARFILDVGCSGGLLGKSLKERNSNMRVWGIENNTAAAREAERHLDRVIVADIEKEEALFDNEICFDCIICADILEHLRDPWTVMKKFRRHLSPGGRVICSIPNIAHYKVVKDIVRDRWLYREEGVLDIDHLRFFTLATIKNLCTIAGYAIIETRKKRKANGFLTFINKILRGKLDSLLTQQYILVCERRNDR